MRALIQKVADSTFILSSQPELWCSDPDKAFDFSSGLTALQHIRQNQFSGVQVLLYFGRREYDVRLAVTDPARSPGELSTPPLPAALPALGI